MLLKFFLPVEANNKQTVSNFQFVSCDTHSEIHFTRYRKNII